MKMFRIIFVSSVFMFVSVLCHAQGVTPVKNVISLTEVADAVIERGEKFVSIENYQGLLYLQSMAEFAMATKSDELMSEVRAIVKEFEEGKIYRMSAAGEVEKDGSIPIDEDDIDPMDRCLEITVDVVDWAVELVYPEF